MSSFGKQPSLDFNHEGHEEREWQLSLNRCTVLSRRSLVAQLLNVLAQLLDHSIG